MNQNYKVEQLNEPTPTTHIRNGAIGFFFNDNLHIELIQSKSFNQCYFSKEVELELLANANYIFEDCFIESVNLLIRNSGLIEFNNCHINSLQINNRADYNCILNINGTSTIESQILNIDINTSLTLNLKSTTLKIINGLTRTSRTDLNVNINQCVTIEDDASGIFLNDKITNLKATGSKFTKIISRSTSILNSTEFKNCIISKLMETNGQANLNFLNGYIENLDIIDCTNGSVNFNNTSLKDVSFTNCNGAIINIKEGWNNLNSIQPKRINSLIIDKSNLIIAVKNYSLNLSLLNSYATINISDSTIESYLKIEGSNIKANSEFRNVIFTNGVKFKIVNSEILELKLNTIDWPKDFELDESWISNSNIVEYNRLKESYRQLKVISQKASNGFDTLNFRAGEQKIQKEILRLKKSYSDYLLLLTNDIFSRFGLSYTRPLFHLLGWHGILFLSMILLGKPFEYTIWFLSGTGFDYNLTLKAIGDYLTTLSPVHSFDYLSNATGWPVIIDFAMRILASYFIYYFVSATRKFHRD